MTAYQFERLIARAEKAYERFENKCEYASADGHELAKGQEEYDEFFRLRAEVESWRGQFPWVKVQLP